MNKIYNYKPGDKVILLDNDYDFKKNDIGKIIGYNNNGYIINVPNKISTSPAYKPNVWVNNDIIKYYYEKPLYDLFIQIYLHCPIIGEDHIMIKSFIDLDRTLTDEELIICQNMWEKYNR